MQVNVAKTKVMKDLSKLIAGILTALVVLTVSASLGGGL